MANHFFETPGNPEKQAIYEEAIARLHQVSKEEQKNAINGLQTIRAIDILKSEKENNNVIVMNGPLLDQMSNFFNQRAKTTHLSLDEIMNVLITPQDFQNTELLLYNSYFSLSDKSIFLNNDEDEIQKIPSKTKKGISTLKVTSELVNIYLNKDITTELSLFYANSNPKARSLLTIEDVEITKEHLGKTNKYSFNGCQIDIPKWSLQMALMAAYMDVNKVIGKTTEPYHEEKFDRFKSMISQIENNPGVKLKYTNGIQQALYVRRKIHNFNSQKLNEKFEQLIKYQKGKEETLNNFYSDISLVNDILRTPTKIQTYLSNNDVTARELKSMLKISTTANPQVQLDAKDLEAAVIEYAK